MFLQSLFEGENSIPINRLMDEMSWSTSRNDKVVHCMMPFKMLNLHYTQWGGWLTFLNNCKPTIGGSPSWIWTNVCDFIWPKSKQQTI